MPRFKEVLEQVWVYTSAFALTQLVSVVGAILIRHFLGPLQTGVWALVQVIMNYTDYANLGVTYAIPIEIPYKRGQGKLEEAEHMKNVVFTFSFLTSILFSCGILFYTFVQREKIPSELFYGLLIASGIVILQQMNNILISLLRAYKNFNLAGRQMAWSSLVNLILVAGFSFVFKLYGFMFGMILSFLFNIIYIFYHESFNIRWRLDFRVLKDLMTYGLPLMILTFAGTILLTLDKIVIARYLGLTELGLYSIAVMVSGFVCSVPNAIGVVLLPNLSEKLAESGHARGLKGYFLKSNHVFLVLMPLLIGAAWFFVPLVIFYLIPKFEGGISALQALVLGSFFIGLTQTYSNFIVVNKQHWKQFPLTLVVCLAAFGLMLFTIRSAWGIRGIALAMSLSMFLNFSVLYFFSGRLVMPRRELFGEYFRIILLFSWMVVVLLILNRIFPDLPRLPRAACQCGILLAVYTPMIWSLDRDYQIFEVFRNKFSKKKNAGDGLDAL